MTDLQHQGAAPQPYRAAIFDLDGTLLDTLADLTASINRVLAAAGHPPHPPDRVRCFIGDGAETLVRRALPPRRRDPAQVARLLADFGADYALRWADATGPYPGVPALLDALAARGVPLAVLSNKPERFTVEMVGRLLEPWTFASVHGARDDRPLKPDPAGALLAARRLGHDPARCALVGDSEVDIRTARGAGMGALGVSWGFRGRAALLEAGAHRVVDHPRELLPLFA